MKIHCAEGLEDQQPDSACLFFLKGSEKYEATEVVITKEMEEEEKQLMEEGERNEQEMMIKVCHF